jgi:Domain of unknown function (DUF4468) with TBP-like fold
MKTTTALIATLLFASTINAFSQEYHTGSNFMYLNDTVLFHGIKIKPGDMFSLGVPWTSAKEFFFVEERTTVFKTMPPKITSEFKNLQIRFEGVAWKKDEYFAKPAFTIISSKKKIEIDLLGAFETGEFIIPGKSNMDGEPLPELPLKDGVVTYEIIDSSIKKTKQEFYKNARQWFSENFKDSKSVIQVDDPNAGDIIGKGIFKITYYFIGEPKEYDCEFILKVNCRDNKYRIQLYNISMSSENSSSSKSDPVENYLSAMQSIPYNRIGNEISIKATATVQSLRDALNKKGDDF